MARKINNYYDPLKRFYDTKVLINFNTDVGKVKKNKQKKKQVVPEFGTNKQTKITFLKRFIEACKKTTMQTDK
ncbi:hypothetical protein DERF_005942 [Dermatophagoides farinae]|uniref:Uncharacterized protein n=1 Tax=Dermatophagoides farinae TaxID=6954 RepID=A0A922IAK0_DERFA|nr:hypothetical protein DERF_005942 [Dermatophagoides farinae]